jgi:hypothetical protein
MKKMVITTRNLLEWTGIIKCYDRNNFMSQRNVFAKERIVKHFDKLE